MNYNIYYENELVSTLNKVKDVVEYCDINRLKIVYEFEDPYEEYVDIFTCDVEE